MDMIYYLPNLDSTCITGDEAMRYIATRVQVHDTIQMMDGRGNTITATLTEVDKKKRQIAYAIQTRHHHTRPPQRVILQAKTDKKYLEKMIEVAPIAGITDVWIITTDFSDARQQIQHERLQSIAIRSCEQCHQPWLPNIRFIQTPLDTLIENHPTLILDADGLDWKDMSHAQQSTCTSSAVCIGPEGGFSPAEKKLFTERNLPIISCGSQVLPSWLAGYTFATLLDAIPSQTTHLTDTTTTL